MNASLVMQDQQTDTYWSLMKGIALEGELKGQQLEELPVGEKVTWKEWQSRYPDTEVLSVNGKQDGKDRYGGYFTDKKGFHGLESTDERMETKTPIFAFHRGDRAYAVRHELIVDGKVFELPDGQWLFLYRTDADSIRRSTSAFVSSTGFAEVEGKWTETANQEQFDQSKRRFLGDEISRIGGFDTYWYNWSLNNPDTLVLGEKEG